jgi:hypothetical protein
VTHVNFQALLLLVADLPEYLRRCDVERVLTEAVEMECLKEFIEWLFLHELKRDTRAEIEEWANMYGMDITAA